jgi:hypothetical protein
MAIPTDRQSFKEHCLRRLGWPAINIEVPDDNIEDRIDEALWFYATYHYGGTEKTYYKYQITQTDKDNKYVTLPANIIGAVRIFDLGSPFGSGDLFNVTYQVALNDLWTITNFNLVPYYMAMNHIHDIQLLLVGKQPIRYNRNTNKFYLDTKWDRFAVGQYLVIECSMIVDPDDYTNVWSDTWLQRYAACLIKETWGQILTKFDEVPLVSGMKLNATGILNDAQNEKQKLEDDMVATYSLPPAMIIG